RRSTSTEASWAGRPLPRLKSTEMPPQRAAIKDGRPKQNLKNRRAARNLAGRFKVNTATAGSTQLGRLGVTSTGPEMFRFSRPITLILPTWMKAQNLENARKNMVADQVGRA